MLSSEHQKRFTTPKAPLRQLLRSLNCSSLSRIQDFWRHPPVPLPLPQSNFGSFLTTLLHSLDLFKTIVPGASSKISGLIASGQMNFVKKGAPLCLCKWSRFIQNCFRILIFAIFGLEKKGFDKSMVFIHIN